jgi:hypothetical protein
MLSDYAQESSKHETHSRSIDIMHARGRHWRSRFEGRRKRGRSNLFAATAGCHLDQALGPFHDDRRRARALVRRPVMIE